MDTQQGNKIMDAEAKIARNNRIDEIEVYITKDPLITTNYDLTMGIRRKAISSKNVKRTTQNNDQERQDHQPKEKKHSMVHSVLHNREKPIPNIPKNQNQEEMGQDRELFGQKTRKVIQSTKRIVRKIQERITK